MERPAVTKAEDAHCPSPEDVQVLQMWGRTHAAVESLTETVYADVASRTGLPRSSFEALWFLYFATGRSAPMSALGRELRFSTAGITKLTEQGVQAVEEAGLVLAEAVRIVGEIGLAQFEELTTLLTRLSPVIARCPSTARRGQPVG